MKWKEVKLEELCDKITDGSHWSPKAKDEGMPMASVKDMHDYGFNILFCKKITISDYEKLIKNDCVPKTNDILIAKDGSYLKYIIHWEKNIDVGLLSSIAILRPNIKLVNPSFLKYLLASPYVKGDMKNYVTGSALPRIILRNFKKINLKVPPLPIQKKIASILSAYDNLIENNLRRIELLEKSARELYKEWFVRYKFPGYEKVKFVDGLPVGWERKKIKTILKKIASTNKIPKSEYERKGEIPCIDQSTSLIGGYTNNEDSVIDSPLPIILFGDHTRILKFIDFPFARGADGTQLLYPSISFISVEFFYFSLLNVDLSNYFYARHFKFLKEEKIIIPTIDKIKIFTNFVKENMKQIKNLREQSQLLKQA